MLRQAGFEREILRRQAHNERTKDVDEQRSIRKAGTNQTEGSDINSVPDGGANTAANENNQKPHNDLQSAKLLPTLSAGRSHQPRRRLMGDSIPEQRDSSTGGNQGKTGNGMHLRTAYGDQRWRGSVVLCEEQITIECVHGSRAHQGRGRQDKRARLTPDRREAAAGWRQARQKRKPTHKARRRREGRVPNEPNSAFVGNSGEPLGVGGLFILPRPVKSVVLTDRRAGGFYGLGRGRSANASPRDAALYTTR